MPDPLIDRKEPLKAIKRDKNRKVRLYPKDLRPPDLTTRAVTHDHGFEVREDQRSKTAIKETIIIPSLPTFTGDHFILAGSIDTDKDLIYGELHVFDAAGAIDHFAEMSVKDGKWEIKIRRAWLEGRAYPVYVDPTLLVDGNDISLYRDTGGGGCFAAGTRVRMAHGATWNIENIDIGDTTSMGDVVATLRTEGYPVYDYHGVYVTADHPVYHNGVWRLVKDVLYDIPPVRTPSKLYLIETTSKRMLVQAPSGERIEFAAYDGIRTPHADSYQRSVCELLQKDVAHGHHSKSAA